MLSLSHAGGQDWRWQDRKRSRPPQAAPSLGRPGVVKDDACSVYVRNLPFHGTKEDIEAHFSPAGDVVDIRRKALPDGAPWHPLPLPPPSFPPLPAPPRRKPAVSDVEMLRVRERACLGDDDECVTQPVLRC